jgi:hypothetical protein
MADRIERRFLVIISIKDCSPQHLLGVIPRIQETLRTLAIGPIEQAFRASRGDVFGHLLRSRSFAAEIRAKLETPGAASSAMSRADMPFLTNDDLILVLELGEDFTGRGFTRAWTWLQHH